MPQRPSLAWDFFEQITQQKARAPQFLKALIGVDAPTFETEWLDFKGWWPNIDDAKIKEIWSQALSGFANNQGGVLVWGIQADKKDRVDAANNLALVPKPNELVTRLLELNHAATDPPIAGIEVRSFISDDDNGKGFVVCFIPESDFAPHRAEHCVNKPFFIRSGDDFVPVGVSILRRLFYTKITHRIKAALKPIVWGSTPSMLLTLTNIGHYSIEHLYVGVQCKQRILFDISKGGFKQTLGLVDMSPILHPQMNDVLPLGATGNSGFEGTEWTITVYAKDMEQKRAVMHFDKAEVSAECL